MNLNHDMILRAMEIDPRGFRDTPNQQNRNGQKAGKVDSNGNLSWLAAVNRTTCNSTNVPENVLEEQLLPSFSLILNLTKMDESDHTNNSRLMVRHDLPLSYLHHT